MFVVFNEGFTAVKRAVYTVGGVESLFIDINFGSVIKRDKNERLFSVEHSAF